MLSSAMLTSQADPLAAAAWQAHIALVRVVNLLDLNPPDNDDRPDWINDLAARGAYIRAAAHRLLAAEQAPANSPSPLSRTCNTCKTLGPSCSAPR